MNDWPELEEHLRTRPAPSMMCVGASYQLLSYSHDLEAQREFAHAALEWVEERRTRA